MGFLNCGLLTPFDSPVRLCPVNRSLSRLFTVVLAGRCAVRVCVRLTAALSPTRRSAARRLSVRAAGRQAEAQVLVEEPEGEPVSPPAVAPFLHLWQEL